MTQEEISNILNVIRTANISDKAKHSATADVLKLAAESFTKSIFSSLINADNSSVQTEPQRISKDKVRNSGFKFNQKEINKMPLKYQKVFAHGDKIVHYRQKSNGVFEARYHRAGIHVEVSSKDLKVLKEKFITALNNLAATGNVKAKSVSTILFNDFAESWLKIKEKTTKPATYKEYKRLFEHDIAPHFKDRTLAEIDRGFLQNFLFRYIEEGKNRTADKLHLVLRCILDLAASDYKFDSPMTKVVLPKYQTKKGKAFTYEEEKQLVDYCKAHPELSASSALLVLLYTGMRRSELPSLRILDDNWMQCETSKEKMGQDNVCRRIPFTPMMRKVLPFIDFEKAKATNFNTINTTIKRLFPNHHTHELRYTFITRAKECHVDPELVMLWDGHSFDKDVKTYVVDRGYTDFSEKYQLQEAQKYDYTL